MGYDAMGNDLMVPSMLSGKKKRANRSAKLKQCKLDARREQWLSQVKGKGDCKVVATPLRLLHPPRAPTGKIDSRTGTGEYERDDMPLHECSSDLDSPTHNPAIRNPYRRNSSPRNSVSSRSSCMDSTSTSVSDGEGEEDTEGKGEENGVLDDWEAVADALSEDVGSDDHRHRHRHHSDPVITSVEPAVSPGIPSEAPRGGSTTKPEPVRSSPRAWKPDDTSRPQSLPGIFPRNAERDYWVSQQRGILPLPTPCPICYEDFDLTDSSFLPCSCGFRLCLFCHKRILEADGRCPGCRKQYDSISGGAVEVNMGGMPLPQFRLSHPCCMGSRP